MSNSPFKKLYKFIKPNSGDDEGETDMNQDSSKLSSMLEAELDDYFSSRAVSCAPHFSDKSKKIASQSRDTENPDIESACCYSGCPACPWGYVG